MTSLHIMYRIQIVYRVHKAIVTVLLIYFLLVETRLYGDSKHVLVMLLAGSAWHKIWFLLTKIKLAKRIQ